MGSKKYIFFLMLKCTGGRGGLNKKQENSGLYLSKNARFQTILLYGITIYF